MRTRMSIHPDWDGTLSMVDALRLPGQLFQNGTAPSHVIPAPSHVISRTLPRHSREGGNLHLPASNLTEQNSRTTIGLWRLSETTTQGGSPMRETSELPTTSLRAPNHHSSFPDLPTSFPDLPTSFPHPPTSFPRRRESNSPSTQSYRIQHNPIKSYRNSCVRVTRTRARGTEFHFLSLPRHSREGGSPFSSLPRHSREGGNPFSSLPRHPAKGGILSLCTGCPQVAADSTYRLELPSHKPHQTEPCPARRILTTPPT